MTEEQSVAQQLDPPAVSADEAGAATPNSARPTSVQKVKPDRGGPPLVEMRDI